MFGGVAFSQAPYAALGGNTFLVSVSESVVTDDFLLAESIRGGILNESLQGADLVAATRGLSSAVSESVVGSDAPSVVVTLNVALAEGANALDAASAVETINIVLTGVQAHAVVKSVLVWGPITPDQNPDWVVVDDSQSPGWSTLPS